MRLFFTLSCIVLGDNFFYVAAFATMLLAGLSLNFRVFSYINRSFC